MRFDDEAGVMVPDSVHVEATVGWQAIACSQTGCKEPVQFALLLPDMGIFACVEHRDFMQSESEPE